MRAEQVVIVSEGTVEKPVPLSRLLPPEGVVWLLGRSPRGAGTALPSPLIHVGTEP